MATLPVTTTPQDKDWSAHRPGQIITYENMRQMADRDPYGSLLVYELPGAALAQWNLIDSDGEPIEKNDEIKEIMTKPWKEIVQYGTGYERQFGQSYLVILKSDNPLTKDQPFVKVYEPDRTEKIHYFNDRTIKKITLWDNDPVSGQQIRITIGEEEAEVDPEKGIFGKDKLPDLFWNIVRHKKNWWEGASYLEPVWDELVGLRLVRAGCVLFAIRVGAGLKIIRVPEGTPQKVIDDMESAAMKLDSLSGFFIVPLEGAEIDIETGTGMIDYEKLKAVLIQSISAKTGLPRAAFEGIEMERQGGSFNEQRIFDYWRQLQREYEDKLKWVLLRYNDYYNWGLEETKEKESLIDKIKRKVKRIKPFEIEWTNRKSLTEMEQAELDEKIANTEATLVAAGIKSADESRPKLGLTGSAPERPADISMSIEDLDDKDDEEDETNDND